MTAIRGYSSRSIVFLASSTISPTLTIILFRISLPEVGVSNNIATAPTTAPHRAPDKKLIVRILCTPTQLLFT